MTIDFCTVQPTLLQNFYGGEKALEGRMHVDAQNRILLGRLVPGASIGLHTHETSSEIIYILEGTGKALEGDVYRPLSPGLCHYCPKGESHSIINDGDTDLVFFAVVPNQ